ncbi:enoyl-CoA hydratase-related protein [Streptosporangium sandarakinum]
MADPVLSSIDGGVLTLTFNRPDRLNAWTDAMGRRYFDLLAEADRDPAVRVVVVTGAGRGFCAGADFEDLTAVLNGSYRREDESDRRSVTFPATLGKPVIAAVNGACAGLGMVCALACDLVFTADEAKWTTAFARRGLIAEYGLSWILPRLIGQARAMDLLLSGRTFTGVEAYELGLVSRSVPGESLLEETAAYARELALHSSPTSMAVMKRQIRGDWNRTLEEAEAAAVRLMTESFGRPDVTEGVAAFLERRAPRFPPLPRS